MFEVLHRTSWNIELNYLTRLASKMLGPAAMIIIAAALTIALIWLILLLVGLR